MSRFTTYVIREIASSFLFLVLLISAILWMGQGLRHIDLLTSENISFFSYFSYVILLLPKILLLTIPICIFLSVLLSLTRLKNDSELIILWATGKSDRSILLKPILFLTTLIYLLLIILSVYITPNSLYEIRQKIIEIRSSGIHSSILKEKKFISPVSSLTIFLQEKNGNIINGLLIHDLGKQDKPQTYIAQSGEFIEEGNKKILRLYNGSIQIFESNQNKISEIAFDTYDLNLSPYNKEENTHVYSDELYTSAIVSNLKGKSPKYFSKYEKEQYAELHSRIINPIYIFIYSLIPLLTIRLSNNSLGRWLFPTIFISIAALLIQIVQITLSNLLVDMNNLIVLNYLLPFVLIGIILLILFMDNFRFKINYAK